MIKYTDSVAGNRADMLEGFFEGWINRPSNDIHLRILENSYAVILAVDDSEDKVVGFISAISDGILAAHISLFEVLPNYRRQGIGSELLKLMLEKLNNLYGISLMCDEHLQDFYCRFGMSPGTGMNIRNYGSQYGRGQIVL